MKNRQVLIGDRLNPFRTNGGGERRNLGRIQVVGRRQTREPERQIGVGGEGVGGIQAEVANQFRPGRPRRLQEPGRTDQNGALQADQEVGDARFARLQNAGAGDASQKARGLHLFHRRAQSVEVEIVESDTVRPQVDRGRQLLWIAHQQVQLRVACDVRRGNSIAHGQGLNTGRWPRGLLRLKQGDRVAS